MHYVVEYELELLILLLLNAGITGMNHHTQFYAMLEIDPKASCMPGKQAFYS